MEWVIRDSSHGGVVADYGVRHHGEVEVGYKPGVTLPAFITYFSKRFDNRRQAENYINKNPNPLRK